MGKKILAAAIKLKYGTVVWVNRPARHFSVILKIQDMRCSLEGSVQGFAVVSNENDDIEFYDRREAWPIADEAGQLLPEEARDPSTMGTLYTEDMW